MLQDLAALTPPAIVCAAVLIGAWAIVRRELAPKRRERAEAAAADGEERAVDREQGRSLYFPTSAIYLRSPIAIAFPLQRQLAKPSRHLIRPFETVSADDNVRLGDMLTVHLLSRDVARCRAALAVSLSAY